MHTSKFIVTILAATTFSILFFEWNGRDDTLSAGPTNKTNPSTFITTPIGNFQLYNNIHHMPNASTPADTRVSPPTAASRVQDPFGLEAFIFNRRHRPPRRLGFLVDVPECHDLATSSGERHKIIPCTLQRTIVALAVAPSTNATHLVLHLITMCGHTGLVVGYQVSMNVHRLLRGEPFIITSPFSLEAIDATLLPLTQQGTSVLPNRFPVFFNMPHRVSQLVVSSKYHYNQQSLWSPSAFWVDTICAVVYDDGFTVPTRFDPATKVLRTSSRGSQPDPVVCPNTLN